LFDPSPSTITDDAPDAWPQSRDRAGDRNVAVVVLPACHVPAPDLARSDAVSLLPDRRPSQID